MDLQQIRAIASDIALSAGAVLMQHWAKPHQETTKANIYDIVTEGDRAAEAVIIPALREAFPDHHIISEEGGGTDLSAREADYFWHVDPVDGTVNFAHNLPHFSVSIAMADRTGAPLVGVVLNPVYGELFSAARGWGASLNGRPLRVTETARLEQALFISGFSVEREIALENMRYWQDFMLKVRDLRRLGSAALDLCFVAAGRVDGFWEMNIHSWDVLAGLLCVQEAGGMTSDYSGGTAQLYTGAQIVASNGALHGAMLEVLGRS